VEESNLGNVQGHVLNFCIVGSFGEGDLEEGIHGGVPDNPVQSLQDVPFHLSEHLVVVKGAAHGLELSYGWDAILLVTIFGSDEQGSTADELVVALVDYTAGAVSVEEVNGKEEGLRQELESSMCFDQEVKQVWTHEPLNLSLNVN
jgi:hypothetical protein